MCYKVMITAIHYAAAACALSVQFLFMSPTKAPMPVLPETTAEGAMKDPRIGNRLSNLNSQ